MQGFTPGTPAFFTPDGERVYAFIITNGGTLTPDTPPATSVATSGVWFDENQIHFEHNVPFDEGGSAGSWRFTI